MPGDEGAVLKALADEAAKAVGEAGSTLAEFTEKTARTADAAADRVLTTESRNAEVFEKIHAEHPPARSQARPPVENPVLRHRISNLLEEGTGGTGSAWEGENGLYLTHEENAAAERFLSRARDAAREITPVVMEVKDGMPGAEAVGYPEHLLKSPASLKRKLATTLYESPVRNLDSAMVGLKDSVRYTLQLPEDGYTEGVDRAISKFQEAGFESVKFNNAWGSPAYQGINSFWRDPRTGHVFEMQFHTRDSFAAKTDTHSLYEQARLPGVPPEKVRALREQQKQMFDSVPRPPGATGIKPPEKTSK